MRCLLCFLLCIAMSLVSALPDTAGANWDPAYSGNYTVGRGGNSVQYVIVHVVQGSYSGCISWFKNPSAKVSAHYVISKGGSITQMVSESNTAWHAGNWSYNQRSIGLEHEGYVTETFPDSMYRSSAALVREICNRHGIPKDRNHIIGHIEVPGATHTDPGKNWDWNKFMMYVNSRAPIVPSETENLQGAPAEEHKLQLTGIRFGVEKLQKSAAVQENSQEIISVSNIVDEEVAAKVGEDQYQGFPAVWTDEIPVRYETTGQADLYYVYDRYDCELWRRSYGGEWQKMTDTSAYAFRGYRIDYRK